MFMLFMSYGSYCQIPNERREILSIFSNAFYVEISLLESYYMMSGMKKLWIR